MGLSNGFSLVQLCEHTVKITWLKILLARDRPTVDLQTWSNTSQLVIGMEFEPVTFRIYVQHSHHSAMPMLLPKSL